MLRGQVAGMGLAARVTTGGREITALKTDLRPWRQVIGRREFPAIIHRDRRVIAGMVVRVGNQRVEAHPAEKYGCIDFRLN